MPFPIIQSGNDGAATRLAQRHLAEDRSDPWKDCAFYQPSDGLLDAVNTALEVGAPLLITGDPGTGKTMLAYWAAVKLGLKDNFHRFDVRSSSTSEDLVYGVDRVRYLHDANLKAALKQELPSIGNYLHPGPLWRCYESGRAGLVLMDEIDKAPRDFPNDLLGVLDRHRITVPETGQELSAPPDQPPLVVITSNGERRLPDAFLRRCVYHHIRFSEEQVRAIVRARSGMFPALTEPVKLAALQCFFAIRRKELRRAPSTGELLVWLLVLAARGTSDGTLLDAEHPKKIPALGCLIKEKEDREALGLDR
jgi:MoxR-like ATPase